MSKLESDVIVSAIASNLLSESKERFSAREGEEVIGDFMEAQRLAPKRWARVRKAVGVIGAVAFMGVGIAGAVVERRYRDLAFPVGSSF